MKNILLMSILFIAGCATASKPVIWETSSIPRNYSVLGPVSVSEQLEESNAEMIQGLAGYVTADGRITKQLPGDMQNVLNLKREQYKEMIFDKLAQKAKEYKPDAIIGTEYSYLPPYLSFSKKALVTAKGQMVKYS